MTRHAAIRPNVCHGCPFTTGARAVDPRKLEPDRRAEIAAALAAGESFPCHIEAYADTPPGPAGPRQCTGAAVLLHRAGTPNLIMVAAVEFGEPPFCDPGPGTIPDRTLDQWATLDPNNPNPWSPKP